MEISESNLLVEAAESGNFAAFCVFSLLEGVNLQKISDFESLYEEIRENLPECEETQDSWFSLSEFFDFYSKQNNTVPLFEIASMATRLKLRRAAKRTSKVRARKRKIRERLRKNKTQLKKRAYNQVKTELRRRLTGGKPWSSLSLSTRARIDSIISKRKPMLNRMVRQRTQKMPAQESQRLRKLSMRESISHFCKYLIEKQTEQKERESNRERKRRFDRRNKEDPARLINRARIVKDVKGKTKLVDVDSVKKGYHIEVKKLKSPQEAQRLCKLNEEENNFIATNTSKEVGVECTENQGENNMTDKPGSDPGAGVGAVVPPPPPTGDRADAGATEKFNVIATNMLTIESQEKLEEFQTNLPEAQQAYRSGKVGAEVTPKQQQALTFIRDKFEEYGLNDKEIETALDKDAAIGIAFEAGSRINQKKINNGDRTLASYYSIAVGTQRYKTTVDGVDGTGKPDLLFIPMEKINPDGNMDSKKINQELQKWQKEYVRLLKKNKKTPKDFEKLAEMQSGIVKVSQKTGQAQTMSGALSESGDATVLFQKVLESEAVPEETKSTIRALLEKTKELNRIITLGTLEQSAEISGIISSQRFTEHVNELKSMLDKIVNDPEVKKIIIRNSWTGEHKFDPNDPTSAGGIATHLLTISPDGTQVEFTEINDELVEKVAPDVRIYLRLKSVSVNTALESQNKELYGRLEAEVVSNAVTQALQTNPNLSEKDQNKLIAKTKTEFYEKVSDFYKKIEAVEEISWEDADEEELQKRIADEDIKTNQVDEYRQYMLHRKKSQVFIERNPGLSEEDRKSIEASPILRANWLALAAQKVNENLVVRFSHNSLLRMLLEFNADNPDKANIERENYIKTMMEYQERIDKIQFEYAGTDIFKLMQIFDVSIDTIRMDPIDITKYIPDQGDGRFNSIYVNGKYHQVPLVVSEMYSVLAKSFLEENKKRNYRSEYDNYHSKPDQRKNRSKRNMARRWAERKGLVRKGDGKDVDHKNGDPRDNSPKNLRVRSRSTNRADND